MLHLDCVRMPDDESIICIDALSTRTDRLENRAVRSSIDKNVLKIVVQVDDVVHLVSIS